jgi:hypothetical protein
MKVVIHMGLMMVVCIGICMVLQALPPPTDPPWHCVEHRIVGPEGSRRSKAINTYYVLQANIFIRATAKHHRTLTSLVPVSIAYKIFGTLDCLSTQPASLLFRNYSVPILEASRIPIDRDNSTEEFILPAACCVMVCRMIEASVL